MWVVLADGRVIKEPKTGTWRFWEQDDAQHAADNWTLAKELQAQGKRLKVTSRWYRNVTADCLGRSSAHPEPDTAPLAVSALPDIVNAYAVPENGRITVQLGSFHSDLNLDKALELNSQLTVAIATFRAWNRNANGERPTLWDKRKPKG